MIEDLWGNDSGLYSLIWRMSNGGISVLNPKRKSGHFLLRSLERYIQSYLHFLSSGQDGGVLLKLIDTRSGLYLIFFSKLALNS
jgi:hypothetical protein